MEELKSNINRAIEGLSVHDKRKIESLWQETQNEFDAMLLTPVKRTKKEKNKVDNRPYFRQMERV